jgi:hypothetical protein
MLQCEIFTARIPTNKFNLRGEPYSQSREMTYIKRHTLGEGSFDGDDGSLILSVNLYDTF